MRGHEQRRQLAEGKALGPRLRAILRNRFLDRCRQNLTDCRREVAYAEVSLEVIEAPQDSALRVAQLRRTFLDSSAASARLSNSYRSRACPMPRPGC